MSVLKAVVFDWAGTLVDFGSCAPAAAFVKVFQEFGITITNAEARGPMGMAKFDHIMALGQLHQVQSQWQAIHGGVFDERAACEIYQKFVPMNAEIVGEYSGMIPGAVSAIDSLRSRGLRIGSTTGYVRDIMAHVLPRSAAQGFTPDSVVCADDLWTGRPTAVMMWKSFLDLQVSDPNTVIKVDDTVVGIQEGLNAGTWTVGISLSGNGVGMSLADIAKADASLVADLNAKSRQDLLDGGAHWVIDTVADLPALLPQIERAATFAVAKNMN